MIAVNSLSTLALSYGSVYVAILEHADGCMEIGNGVDMANYSRHQQMYSEE